MTALSASTYYEWVTKSPTRAQLRDAELVAVMVEHRAKRSVVSLGSRKMWLRLRRHGFEVALGLVLCSRQADWTTNSVAPR